MKVDLGAVILDTEVVIAESEKMDLERLIRYENWLVEHVEEVNKEIAKIRIAIKDKKRQEVKSNYFPISSYIRSEERSLKNWEEGLKEIEEGTFKYDGSMPKSCVDALYKSKVQIVKDVLEWLYNLDEDKERMMNSLENSEYLRRVNK